MTVTKQPLASIIFNKKLAKMEVFNYIKLCHDAAGGRPNEIFLGQAA
jgi:hypothetical protein